MNPRIAFQTIWDRCQHTAEVYDALKYLQALAEMPSEKQWIPCAERLPGKDDTAFVLVNVDIYERPFDIILVPANSVNQMFKLGHINAWMPLPDPYKKEGKAD